MAEQDDSRNLRPKAKQHTSKLLELASGYFGAKLETPLIRFDLRGKTAGQVRTGSRGYLIRYNADLLERHPREFLSRTVPHEAAHVVVFSLFGRGATPHGREWRAVMAIFGASPERCHDYDVKGLQTRRLRQYDYRCACRTHKLTSIRHNRVVSGQVYLCKRCGSPLAQVRQPATY